MFVVSRSRSGSNLIKTSADGAWTTTTVTVNSPPPQPHILDGLKKKVQYQQVIWSRGNSGFHQG